MGMNGRVKAILFDAGNTLVYVDPGRMLQIFRSGGVDADPPTFQRAELNARRKLHRGIEQGAKGTEPEVWKDYFTTLLSGNGVPGDALEEMGRAVHDAHAREHLWTWVADGTEDTLQELLDAGYRLAVISNADGRVEDVLASAGLRDYFEFVIDSEVVGMEKPDRAIFLEACRRLGLPPEACLYVGDLYPVDYLGARGAGLSAILLDPLDLYGDRAECVATLAELPAFVERMGAGS